MLDKRHSSNNDAWTMIRGIDANGCVNWYYDYWVDGSCEVGFVVKRAEERVQKTSSHTIVLAEDSVAS